MAQHFQFDGFVLDQDKVELRRDGVLVAIPPKAFRLLAYLIAHRDRVVSKNELFDNVWAGELVTESSLTFCVATTRRAIGEVKAAGSRIRATHGTGYRFVADVRPIERDAEMGVGEQPVFDSSSKEPIRSRFVGRTEEMKLFEAAIGRLCDGRGSVVLLGGEPGIGKTRAMEEFAALAAERGVLPLFGRALDGELGLPFWLWVDVVQNYLRLHDGAAVRETMGPGIADIAQLVPSVRQRVGEVPEPPALDSDQARLRLIESIAAFLRNAAARQPLLVALDDLQWADASSLLLLQYLAHDISSNRILLVATYRDTEVDATSPLGRVRQRMARTDHYQNRVLAGLLPSEIAGLMESIGSDRGGWTDDDIATLAARTGGNPFFLEQLFSAAYSSPLVAPSNGVAGASEMPIPEGIRAIVQQRLARVSKAAQRALAAASIFGQQFTFADLGQLAESDLPEGVLLDALDELATARLIEEVALSPGTYRFGHALIREAVHDGLGSARRARLHEAVAASLAALPDPNPADLAYHYLHCGTDAALRSALEYSQRAATRAADQHAFEEAVRHGIAARSLLERVAPDDTLRACEITLALAEAYYVAGHVPESRREFDAAAEAARRLASPTLFARAALGALGTRPTVDEQPIGLLREALTRLDSSEQELRARVLARIGLALGNVEGTYEERRELATQAVALARTLGSARTLALVLQDAIVASWHPDTFEQRRALIDELEVSAAAAGMPGWVMGAHVYRIAHTMEAGDLQSVRLQLAEFRRSAERLRQPAHLWNALAISAAEAAVSGRLPEAEAFARRAHHAGVRMGEDASANIVLILQLYTIGRHTGRVLEAQAEAQTYPDAQSPQLRLQWAAPFMLVAVGESDLARQMFAALVPSLPDLPQRDSLRGRFTAAYMAAATAFYLDERDAAAVLYQQLLPYASRWIVTSFGIAVGGCVASSLGGLAATMGDWNAAVAHFEYALRVHREQGVPGELAVTQVDYGLALYRRGGKRDRTRADHLIAEAAHLATTHGLGMIDIRIGQIQRDFAA